MFFFYLVFSFDLLQNQNLVQIINSQQKYKTFKVHSMNELIIKYSESPVLIKHAIPVHLSLKIMDSINFKIQDLNKGKKIKQMQLIINPQKQQKHKNKTQISTIIFKNKSCTSYQPKTSISTSKLKTTIKKCQGDYQQNLIKNVRNQIQNYRFTNDKLVKQLTFSTHVENTSRFINFSNRQIHKFQQNIFSESPKTKNISKKQKRAHTVVPSRQLQSEEFIPIRKNSLTFSFNRNSGLRKNLTEKGNLVSGKKHMDFYQRQYSQKIQSLRSMSKIKSKNLQNTKNSIKSEMSQHFLQKYRNSSIMIQGRKAPQSEIDIFSSVNFVSNQLKKYIYKKRQIQIS